MSGGGAATTVYSSGCPSGMVNARVLVQGMLSLELGDYGRRRVKGTK